MAEYFSAENYVALREKILAACRNGDADAREDLDYLRDALQSFFAYVEEVAVTETRLDTEGALLTGNDYRELFESCDQSRHQRHEAAIVQARVLNRLAESYNVGPVFLGDPGKRLEVAATCLEAVDAVFQSRRL